MEEKKTDIFTGFFYYFGFIENPAERKAKSILKESASEKIKGDLKKINKEYRNQYEKLRKEILCLD